MSFEKEVVKIINELKAGANPAFAEKIARFGIENSQALGWRTPHLKELAKPYRRNQALAMALYQQPYHEAKLLTAFIGDTKKVTLAEADVITAGFYSWDLVDQICSNLFAKASFVWQLPQRYALKSAEYERRAAVVMVVQLAQKHKNCADEDLLQFLPLLKDCATDERNFVKKAVSWALRTLGKRSRYLNASIQDFAQELLKSPSAAAQWSARDTLREITQEKYIERLKR